MAQSAHCAQRCCSSDVTDAAPFTTTTCDVAPHTGQSCACVEVPPPNPQDPDEPACKRHRTDRTQRFEGRVVAWDKSTGLGEVDIEGMVERPLIDWKDCDRCAGMRKNVR